MKKLFLILLFSTCSTAIFAQELKNPTLKTPFYENNGNFLVLTFSNKIGKSEVTIDNIKKMQKEMDELKRVVATLKRQLDEQQNKIRDLQRKVK